MSTTIFASDFDEIEHYEILVAILAHETKELRALISKTRFLLLESCAAF
jgi:hypothetical protein